MDATTPADAVRKSAARCDSVSARTSTVYPARFFVLPVFFALLAVGRLCDAAEHHHHDSPPEITQHRVEYEIPRLSVKRMDNKEVDLTTALSKERPVILNFIFTSCTAICPMTSQILSALLQTLEDNKQSPQVVSISIDPEYDTPARLTSYAKKYNAPPNWTFYTGSVQSSMAIQKAFNVYHGDKMNHVPVTFFRKAQATTWLRVDGLASPGQLYAAYTDVNR